MSHLYHSLGKEHSYFDKKNYSKEAWLEKISNSTTVYVGNLSFFTPEHIIYELFNSCGPVKQVIMGLNSQTLQFCGFCFVQYYDHKDALAAVSFLNQSYCDGREIRVDWDSGDNILENRRYGRGTAGFQWRDELRTQIDPDRIIPGTIMNGGRGLNFSHGTNYHSKKNNRNRTYRRNNSGYNNTRSYHRIRHSSDVNLFNEDDHPVYIGY
ncbi:RNA recognition family protein [Cryptosporidium andersoni]|uniref:Nuclear cap-binding protein subunit 2 n=1 Tax=Cryptosporidium andersoni TaxID=117008 RepID=A0A1J4MPS8_9CRYT|nr:RNA recognition family protein [Cryptosporidium andersoni]